MLSSKITPLAPLGARVRDRLTGFTGIVIARTEWLYGCVRVGIAPEEVEDGKQPADDWWCDEGQVEVLEERAHQGVEWMDETPGPGGGVRVRAGKGGPSRPTGARSTEAG